MISRRTTYSVIIAGIVITSTLFVISVYIRPPNPWNKTEYLNDANLNSTEIRFHDFHDAVLNIRFVDSESLVYRLDYLADGPNAIKILSSCIIYQKGDVKVLNVSLGSSIVYEIIVEGSEITSTNLTTTITYDENAHMDRGWFGYEVEGGSFTIIVKDSTQFVGDEESVIRMTRWSDDVNLRIDLPDTVGGYAFLEYTNSTNIACDEWYPNLYVNGGYPTYATHEREGYKLVILVRATDITGFLR